jgi:flagellar hook-associated protein 1 FlgK
LTRLSDNTVTTLTGFPQTVDGVTIDLASGAAGAGDSFLIRPTVNGASGISVAIADPKLIAPRLPADPCDMADRRNAERQLPARARWIPPRR